MSMRIKVTEEDIAAGLRKSCEWCPIALACMRAAGARRVEVSGLYIQVLGTLYEPPSTAVDFMEAFDRGETVAPFAFDLIEDEPTSEGR